MKKIKIIIFIVIIIMIAIGIYLHMNLSTKNTSNGEVINQQETNQNISQDNTIEEMSLSEVTNASRYFSIKSCVDKYMEYISNQNKDAILGVLDVDYVSDNDITEENVLEFVTQNSNNTTLDFDIQKMLISNNNNNDNEDIETYYVYGIIRSQDGNRKDGYLTVKIDMENLVFCIIPNVPEEVFNE